MADRRIGNRSMGRRGRSKVESGTCNVCSAPCSSCMHRNASFTGSMSDESSDENSHGVVASQCSSRVNALGSSHNTASEASNLDNSNHESSHNLLSDHQARNIPGQGKFKEKAGAENNQDQKNSLTESSTHSDESGMIGKSGENIPSNKAEEPNASAMSERESESAGSELMELDVKVCDICGDAGREDLLAICSRCSDGAEHTYCMRVMLQKVPEGDWLCEECKFAEEAEKQKLETEGKRETEANLNTQSSSKRQIDKIEAAPDAKRRAVEAPTGSPKRPVLPRLSALSRETSFKGVEKTTRKLAHHSSFNSHSSDDTESTRSTDSQLQSPKGSFCKSYSFNSSSSRPKVRQVDDVMLPRQKTAKENASRDVKEGFSKNVGRSMSTSCNDSKVKGSKQLKDWSTEANPSASTVDQKLISRGNSSSSYANGARDLKGLQSDAKQGSLSKQARHLSRNRLEDIVASVGETYTNEKCSSSEHISSEAKRKNELANVDGLSRSREFRVTGEKSKDAVGNRQRSDLLSGSKGLPSQKGQNAEPTETSCASGSNVSTTRNIREDINKGNRLRAAVDAALRKKPSFSKNRGLEQSDLPSVSNVDSSCDKVFQKAPTKVPVVRDWPVGLQGGHPNLQTDKQTIEVNGNQFTLAGAGAGADADAMAASQSVEPEFHLPSVKPVMRDLPVVAPSVLSTTSAIPEHEYIWQGDMEVQKSRFLSVTHCGMQAYLSTLASPKVVEVVNQFPVKVILNEVPRLSTWPTQFQDIGAKEDHVALFFFAKDIESYEKSYKPLVDNMIQKDLALKGNFEGVELLIFSSNQLPPNCQRWNMLFFLWGVFRGEKKKHSNPLKNTPLPASNALPNIGKSLSTREGFGHENPSNRESSIDRGPGRMQSCMKEENETCGAIDKEKESSVSYGAVEETEEGEIGASPHLKDEKTSGIRAVNFSEMNQEVGLDDERLCEGPVNKKLKTGTGIETECSISRRDTSASRYSGAGEEKKRIVFPLDLNEGKDDDDEMVDNNPRPQGNDNNTRRSLGMVPNLDLALGEEKTRPTMTTTTGVVLPLMGGTSSTEEHRSSRSQKPQDRIMNQDDDAASLSLSLSFSSLEKGQQQQQKQQNERSLSGWEGKKQNVNTPLFLFRDFPDKSS
uniref:Lysine-specific demethylase 5B n=1 Tax=Noccaea caerulescens TaxID=107243 RepID=A0A1J3DZ53_NOCCA